MIHPMTRELAIEELAEEIGTAAERDERSEEVILGGSKVPEPGPVLDDMERRGLVRRRDGEVIFTPAGEEVFRAVIRRHRLAEVLLSQLFQISESAAEGTACQFEHILSGDVTDSICTFLSHPPTCPHGKGIPRGDCCKSFRKQVSPLVRPVDDLAVGTEGRIVFIQHAGTQRLDRLATLGILPGTTVRLIQRHPSVVLKAGETTVALDRAVTSGIYVRPSGANDSLNGNSAGS
jgi:DtxR family Mn-dependent transcriptional regulator